MSHLTIAFVGQCHTVGYRGVPPDSAFPEVCRQTVQASRPETHVELITEPYYHPAELSKAVSAALLRRPRVVVVEVVGWLAIAGSEVVDLSRLPRGVRSAYQRAKHLRAASRMVTAAVPKGAGLLLAAASRVLRPLLPRQPRPTLAEYEQCVSQAIADIRDATVVVQGPGAPNLALDSPRLAPDAIERYRAVNEMARRVAAAHGALFVDRWDTVAGGFYLPGTTRPTTQGHSVWGHLLAEQLLRAGVV